MKSASDLSRQVKIRFVLRCVVGLLGLSSARSAFATDYYVATTGSDSNPGTMTQPFATLQKGADVAAAGDTVYIRGGTYTVTTPRTSGAGIAITKSGTSDTNRIKFWAYPGEIPVFDFSKMTISTSGYTHGIEVTASWVHLKGLEVRSVPENTRSNNGVEVSGAGNDIFELLNMHHNQGNGMFISAGAGGHLVLNCDAHDNYDPTSAQGQGQNADGYGVHYQTSGSPTIVRGCRSWWNSDDGYDLINQEVPVVVENSWAMGNGYANSGTTSPASGNGNGFKMGSSKTGVRHTVRNNVAWKNKAAGFYANHSSGGNTWYNNTSYNNVSTQFNMLASPAGNPGQTIILTGALAHIMRNNVGFPDKNSNMGGVDTAYNTWDLNITPTAADFASTVDTGFMGPRNPDGSLPNIDFMKPATGSKLIDKGTNVQLPYLGAAPDLGAYEYGATTGGASSDGGSSGSASSSAGGSSSSSVDGTSQGDASSDATTSSSGGTGASGGGDASGGTATSSSGSTGSGGESSSGGQASSGSGSSSSTVTSVSGSGASGTGSTPGCGCGVAGAPSSPKTLFGTALTALTILRLRRRPRRVALGLPSAAGPAAA